MQRALQEVVRSSRGDKLDTSNEEELWSGRIWTGRQAARLGLIDAVGTMESVCKEKFGEKVESALITQDFGVHIMAIGTTCAKHPVPCLLSYHVSSLERM